MRPLPTAREPRLLPSFFSKKTKKKLQDRASEKEVFGILNNRGVGFSLVYVVAAVTFKDRQVEGIVCQHLQCQPLCCLTYCWAAMQYNLLSLAYLASRLKLRLLVF